MASQKFQSVSEKSNKLFLEYVSCLEAMYQNTSINNITASFPHSDILENKGISCYGRNKGVYKICMMKLIKRKLINLKIAELFFF